MDYSKEAIRLHKKWGGKIDYCPKMEIKNKDDLSVCYTPGVAAPCLEIKEDNEKVWELTGRKNLVAVVTDGTAVLGLGDIGPEAGLPVMEGKCVLFKAFGNVDAVPLCIDSKDVDEIVNTVALLSKSFGGINLEDIAAPRCFEIERKLKERCDIPVFHDDQHGTAIVVLAALLNALKVTGRRIEDAKVVVCGAGSAGIAIVRLLLKRGLHHVIMYDKNGAVCEGAPWMNEAQKEMALLTNHGKKQGTLSEIMQGADAFIGVSGPNLVTADMVRKMAKDPILFPMANPVPEISFEEAKAAGAAVVGTGRSDYPNQINNVLAFPGVFRGALDVRAKDINDEMKLAAADALAELASENLSADYILPAAFDQRVGSAVAAAVAEAAKRSGCARK
ncbi:MAG: NADP-dependent malic enzyme [Oscillospiraceae bacterium]|nr:NADP-dependent malic enzyme [Oscillospiraceae bacterium]